MSQNVTLGCIISPAFLIYQDSWTKKQIAKPVLFLWMIETKPSRWFWPHFWVISLLCIVFLPLVDSLQILIYTSSYAGKAEISFYLSNIFFFKKVLSGIWKMIGGFDIFTCLYTILALFFSNSMLFKGSGDERVVKNLTAR